MDLLSKRSLWMGSLEPIMDEELITNAFDRMGEKVSVKFVRDKVTKVRINTYCFVEFEDQEHAERALKRVNGKPIPNMPHTKFHLAPSRSGNDKDSQQGSSRNSEDSLFVGGLSEDVEENQLFDFFRSRYPTVKEAKLCRNLEGISKGFGFVRFFNEQDRMEALRRMNGVRGLGSKQIFVSPATPKPKDKFGKYEGQSQSQWHHQDTDGYYNQQHLAAQYMQQHPNTIQQHQHTLQHQQQPHPYYGAESWNGQMYQQYQPHYSQPYDYNSQGQSVATPAAPQAQEIETMEEDDDELVDQELHLDVDKMNEEFIQNNEDLYSSLEKSRWSFVGSVTTTMDEISIT